MKAEQDSPKPVSARKPYRWWLFWPLAASSVVGLVGLVLGLIEKVRSGAGGQTYQTGHGYQFSFIGALLLLGVIPPVLVVGAAVRWWQRRDERDFDRRYLKK